MYLLKSLLNDAFTILFGIISFIVAMVLLVYFKMFLAKLFNVNMINRRGRAVIEPESFDNVNSFFAEKTSELIKPLLQNKANPPIEPLNQNSEILKNYINNKLLNGDRTLTIINSKRTISKELVNQRCVLKVVEVGRETFLENDGKRKLIRCDINSKFEMEKVLSKRLFRAALEAENCNNFEEANSMFKEYLNTIQFRFSLFDNSILYYPIKTGDIIEGNIELYKNEHIEFLTVNSKSVNYHRF